MPPNEKYERVDFSTILSRTLTNRCPQCGRGRVFAGYLQLASQCRECNLRFSEFDTADGPAFFVSFLLCIVAGAVSLTIELTGNASIWLHALIWALILVLGTIATLRPTKSLLIALQYHFQAKEVQLSDWKDN